MGHAPDWLRNSMKKPSSFKAKLGCERPGNPFHGPKAVLNEPSQDTDDGLFHAANGGPVRRYAEGGVVSKIFGRLAEGNIDNPESTAYSKYRATAQSDSDAKMHESEGWAGPAERKVMSSPESSQEESDFSGRSNRTVSTPDNDTNYTPPYAEDNDTNYVAPKSKPVKKAVKKPQDESRKRSFSDAGYEASVDKGVAESSKRGSESTSSFSQSLREQASRIGGSIAEVMRDKSPEERGDKPSETKKMPARYSTRK